MDSMEERIIPKEQNTRKSILVYIILLVHILVVGFVFYILYLSLSNEWVFFTWHPILLSVGWILLMSEGIMMFNSHNILTSILSLSYKSKIRYHWIIQTIAIGCSLLGFIIIIVNKNLYEKPHFHTWHAIAGLVSIICCFPACVSGVIALYGFNLKSYIKPVNSKLIHRIFGLVTFIIGCGTVLLSLSTNWFKRNATEAFGVIWLIVLLSISLILILQVGNKIFHRIRMLL